MLRDLCDVSVCLRGLVGERSQAEGYPPEDIAFTSSGKAKARGREREREGIGGSAGWRGIFSGSDGRGKNGTAATATAAATAKSSNSRRPGANNLRARASAVRETGSPLPRAAMMRSPSSRATDRKIRRRSGRACERRRDHLPRLRRFAGAVLGGRVPALWWLDGCDGARDERVRFHSSSAECECLGFASSRRAVIAEAAARWYPLVISNSSPSARVQLLSSRLHLRRPAAFPRPPGT